MKKLSLIAFLGFFFLVCCLEQASASALLRLGKDKQEEEEEADVEACIVCGGEIVPPIKETLTYGMDVYHFCSRYCTDLFKNNPHKYLDKIGEKTTIIEEQQEPAKDKEGLLKNKDTGESESHETIEGLKEQYEDPAAKEKSSGRYKRE